MSTDNQPSPLTAQETADLGAIIRSTFDLIVRQPASTRKFEGEMHKSPQEAHAPHADITARHTPPCFKRDKLSLEPKYNPTATIEITKGDNSLHLIFSFATNDAPEETRLTFIKGGPDELKQTHANILTTAL